MATILIQQYKSVSVALKDIPYVSLKPPQNGNSLWEIIITKKGLLNNTIDDMVITSAPGQSSITPGI